MYSRESIIMNNEDKNKDLSSKTKQGLLWTALFNGLQYIIRFGSSIVLARILFPEDFGLMGIALIVIQFARRLTNFGFTVVLVQRKTINHQHYDTVFIANLILMGLITVALFNMAPWLAHFFNNEKVRPILMVISFDFIFQAISGVPASILKRKMKFKELGFAQTASRMVTLLTPIAFALKGYGVWSLVFGVLLGSLTQIVFLFYFAGWVPKFHFSFQAFRDVFSFGVWVYVGNYIRYFINNVDFFMIGKFLSTTQLGYYERAFNLINLPRKNILRRINNVLFSTYSRLQDNNKKLIEAILKVTISISLMVFPLMIWLFFSAPSLIPVLYGPKWILTIKPLQIMCVFGLINTLAMIFYPVLLAKGLVSQNALYNFIYLIILIGAISVGLKWGINGVAWGVTLGGVFFLGFNLYLSKKYFSFPLIKFFKAQKSAFYYGIIQIVFLIIVKNVAAPYFLPDSWQMLTLLSIVSLVSFVGSHIILRLKDADILFQDIIKELLIFLKKIPLVKRLNILSQKV